MADESSVDDQAEASNSLFEALGATTPAPATNASWRYAKDGDDFRVCERRVAERIFEACTNSDREGFYLGHMRAVLAATADYGDDAFIRVSGVAAYEADDGGGEHWFNGVVVTEVLASRRTDLLGSQNGQSSPE